MLAAEGRLKGINEEQLDKFVMVERWRKASLSNHDRNKMRMVIGMMMMMMRIRTMVMIMRILMRMMIRMRNMAIAKRRAL